VEERRLLQEDLGKVLNMTCLLNCSEAQRQKWMILWKKSLQYAEIVNKEERRIPLSARRQLPPILMPQLIGGEDAPEQLDLADISSLMELFCQTREEDVRCF
jgi:hypothetical protein